MWIFSSSDRNLLATTSVLGLLSIFPPLATDMYLSALGELAISLNTTHLGAELSLSIFFLGLCLGQLLLGNLSDAFGRKSVLMTGAVVYVLTSAILPLVENIYLFNALRFLQAIGASAGMVISRTIVTDLYQGQRAAQLITILVMLLSIGPIISPMLGGILLEFYGWKSIFWTMALVGIIALIFANAVLIESLPEEKRQKDPIRMGFLSTIKLCRDSGFRTWTLIAGLAQGVLFVFITGSSAVFQNGYGFSPIEYGLVFAIVAVALILFGFLNNRLLARRSPSQILTWALPVFALSTCTIMILSDSQSILLFICSLWISVGFVGLVSANAMALAMECTGQRAGIGSAVLGAAQFAIAFGVSSGVALMPLESNLPMAIGMMLPALLAAVTFLLWKQNNTQR